MPTWPRTCSRMPLTVPRRLWRSTILRKTSLHSSRRSSTRSTTLPGIVSLAETSVPTSRMRRSISFTSTSARQRCLRLKMLHANTLREEQRQTHG
ncbi:unnamed protein product [Symbiodinium pilosum]|uniref:Uncharacterized protein n=1 Tax=Symbiodinium pilosum TaxID=2952 RepID=A0A812IQL0_SYMPI|nr:unnamed protein product [Symbiodinium pilosum]